MEIKLRVEIIFMITDKIALPSVQFPSVVSIMLGITCRGSVLLINSSGRRLKRDNLAKIKIKLEGLSTKLKFYSTLRTSD